MQSGGNHGGSTRPASSVELPIRYDESSLMAAAFLTRTARLRPLTPSNLHIAEVVPGWSVLAILCFEYQRTTIGAYGEVAAAWPVVAGRKPPPVLPLLLEGRWPGGGYWVHHLPVTSEIALNAGVSLWGYPKFLADIDFHWEGSTRVCTLREGSEEILRLAVETRMVAVPQQMTLCTYSVLDGELLTTPICVDAVGLRRPLQGRARLSFGAHPVGRELAGLDPVLAHPVEVRWYPTWRALLPQARERVRLSTDEAHRFERRRAPSEPIPDTSRPTGR